MENFEPTSLELTKFKVFYQPKVCVYTGRCKAAEALVRWTGEKQRGDSPAVFIPMMERNGTIEALTNHVISSVCQDIHYIRKVNGSCPIIAINIPPILLESEGFTARLVSLLETHGIEPSEIEVEITESINLSYVKNSKNYDPLETFEQMERSIQAVIAEAKNLYSAGFSIALDDFGTGQNGLRYFATIRASSVKIDRFFTLSISEEAKAQELNTCAQTVSIVIDAARKRGMKSVVEGVENETQLRQILNIGCDEIQGFLFSKPLEIEEFAKFSYEHSTNPHQVMVDIGLQSRTPHQQDFLGRRFAAA